ncbi:MAG: multicopper oxidase domain-containing protein [Thermodesulfobacteriota bacterium]
MKKILLTILFISVLPADSFSETKEYNLVIENKLFNFTGEDVVAMSVNGSVPGPTLRFKEGDIAKINVSNKMDVSTSVHWHGLLVPNREDGVPYVTTPPIKPGTTYTYEFPIRQSGTYWYHSHTGLQEQLGVYGSIVIEPEKERNDIELPEVEIVVVLSDWTNDNPHEVLRTLIRGSEYNNYKKNTMQTVYGVIKNRVVWDNIKRSFKRMPTPDIADIAYDAFLINGNQVLNLDNYSGKKVKLRVINAGSSTYFYLNYAGGNMTIVAADGIDVVPVKTDKILISVAETYDVIVDVPENGAYEFRSTAQDGSGYASLYLGNGKKINTQSIPAPNLYKMHGSHKMEKIKSDAGAENQDMHNEMIMNNNKPMSMNMGRPSPPYEKLKSPEPTTLPNDNKLREVILNLTGDMENYIWSINNKTLKEDAKILIRKGENVRFIMNNKTMMNHPMHLHGHFFRVLNKQGEYSPLKHTVNVAPNETTIIEFEANEEKDWFFHCHILYHMKAGMARIVSYEDSEIDPDIKKIRGKLYKDPIYFWVDAQILTQMSEGVAVLKNTRNSIITNWEVGYDEGEYRIDLTYARYINRFISPFAGIEITNEEQDTRGIFGVYYLLPLLIDSTIWVDTDGDFRFIFDKEMQLTRYITTFGELQFDTESKWEAEVGGTIFLHKNLSLIAKWHNEFGAGIGALIRF